MELQNIQKKMSQDQIEMMTKLTDMTVSSDFHIHSAYSGDGIYRVKELFDQFEEAGLKAVSIADHDCIDATEEAALEAQNRGIDYIPGVEVSAFYNNSFIHILGYGYRYGEKTPLSELLGRISKRRLDNIPVIIGMLQDSGFAIEEEQIYKEIQGQPPMVSTYSRILMEDSRNDDHPMLKDYRPGGPKWLNGSLKFAVDYMVFGKKFYVPELDVSMEECVDAIWESGGVAVMAHPGLWLTEEYAYHLGELRKHGLLGIEAYTPYHTAEQTDYYRSLAERYDLYATHGSDYHGVQVKPKNKLGQFALV